MDAFVNFERCPGGCHDGDFADFDHFCDVNSVTTTDTPIAFAAWLNHISDGRWDGDAGPVDPDPRKDPNP